MTDNFQELDPRLARLHEHEPHALRLDDLRKIATRLRIHSLRMTTAAGSGHPTTCLSAADLAACLFFGEMRWNRIGATFACETGPGPAAAAEPPEAPPANAEPAKK